MIRLHILPFVLLLIGIVGCRQNSIKEATVDMVKDIDGNAYNTVMIGTQVWMAEDLKTTSYSDGTSIPLVTSYEEWSALTTPAYCWYNNDSTNQETYGALKETGSTHWRSPNQGASNESGFSALPGGYRSYNGTFNLLRAYGYWWTSTESNWWNSNKNAPDIVFHRDMRYDNSVLNRYVSEKSNGFCVRCLKDQ